MEKIMKDKIFVSLYLFFFTILLTVSLLFMSNRHKQIDEIHYMTYQTYNMMLDQNTKINEMNYQIDRIISASTTLALEYNNLADAIHYEWVGIVNTRVDK